MSLRLHDKLPQVGTTIFTVMSALAQEHGAINLSQGFPDFPCDAKLKNFVNARLNKDYNQYAPMQGVMRLRQLLQQENQVRYHVTYDAHEEITITSGATEALFCAISALIETGDEVILFEPAYDSYAPVVQLNQAKVVSIPLYPPDFRLSWRVLREKINSRTKLIILNTPHNPLGKVWKKVEIEQIWELIKDKNIALIADEVYEHITFDGHVHYSIRQHEYLRERSIIIGSFGKSLHVTGWKIGYAVGPKELMRLFRKVHQFNVFCSPTPLQWGIADYLEAVPDYGTRVQQLYQQKKDFFAEQIRKKTTFKLLPCEGTYFQLLDYSSISTLPDTEFARILTKKYKVAVIPISVFYSNPFPYQLVRVCFAKRREVLETAIKNLGEL